MRNLKRVLSLALALVMVLGMMVITTSAADYTDAEEITYTEAVEVMSAIGVINGMGDGTFAPKGTLTREQAAKILAYVTLGADADNYLTGSAAPFDDVAATKWSAKYVAYCKNLGIIAGVGDNKFNPAGTLTTVQFAKMLLVAAGIDGTYTGAGWENNVKTAAKDAGLDVITIDNSEITREEACEIALAAMKYAPNAAGWVAKKGDTELKTFTDVADAVVYVATLKGLDTANAADYTYAPVGASGYLLDEVYGVTYNDLTATDEYGRPGIRYTKAPAINLFYADEAVAKYVNSFDEDIADAMIEAKANVFTGANFVYNGGTDANVDALDELYLANGKAINGRTVELYDTDGDKTIDEIIVIEAGLATVGEFVAATAVSDAYVTLSAVQMRGDNLTITVTDDDEKADLYDALAAAYAEDDVVAVTLKPGWHVDLTETCILAVEPTTAVSGKITKVATGGKNCTTVVTIDGTEYALNNMCKGGSALAVKAEGTLYLDAQGKGLGWAEKTTQQAAKPVVYVVDYFQKTEYVTNEMTGIVTPKNTYWALCVDTNGEVVTYQRASDTVKAVNKMCEVTLSYNATLKATVAAFTPVNNTTTGETKATDIKINGNNYYTSDVKFIFVDGQMEELEVVVKEGAQAVASGATKWYEAKAIQNDANNKTTSYVFVSAAVADPTVTVSGVVYAAEGSNASTTQVIYTDAQGDEQTGYEHKVYVDGVATTVVTADSAALNGFITLTEVVEGVYAAETKTGTNLLTNKAIDNMYNGMITINGEALLVDVNVAGVTVVNVSGNNKVPTDATKLATSETVDLVLSADGKSIVTIYVTASTRA